MNIFNVMNYKAFFFPVLLLISLAAFGVKATTADQDCDKSFKNINDTENLKDRVVFGKYLKDRFLEPATEFKSALESAQTDEDFDKILNDYFTEKGSKYAPVLLKNYEEDIKLLEKKAKGELKKKLWVFFADIILEHIKEAVKEVEEGAKEISVGSVKSYEILYDFYVSLLPFYQQGWFIGLIVGSLMLVIGSVLIYYKIKRDKAADDAVRKLQC